MKEHLKSKIFVIISFIFIFSLVVIYSYRLVHYYRLEEVEESTEKTMAEKILLQHEDVVDTEFLKVDDDVYYFRGKVDTNYVRYSGFLWRILSIDSDHRMKLVLDESVTSMAIRNVDMEQSFSYAGQWLKNDFLPLLSESNKFLVNYDFCTDVIVDVSNITCSAKKSSMIGLLSLSDYSRANGMNGFLHKQQYFWLSNGSSGNHNWAVMTDGSLNDGSSSTAVNSYGIRPVIVVDGNIPLISGTGKIDDPYLFDIISSNALADKYIGEYVSYSNMVWRIVGKTEDALKLALDGYILEDGTEVTSIFSYTDNQFDSNDWYQLAYYLNHTFYKILDHPEYVMLKDWNVGAYGDDAMYDYQSTKKKVVQNYVGLLGVGDLFLNDYSDYYLMTPTFDDSTIYTVLDGGRLFADTIDKELKIRPSLYIKNSISVVEGSGTQAEPYVLGGELNE